MLETAVKALIYVVCVAAIALSCYLILFAHRRDQYNQKRENKMKNRSPLLLLLLVFVFASRLYAEDKTLEVKLAAANKTADFERIKRIDIQFQVIQKQVQDTVQPLIVEKNEAVARLCKAEGLKVEDCDVDANAGVVKKKLPPPAPKATDAHPDKDKLAK